MENCIFCKIINGEIPCEKIWEDENFLAFLDLMPSVEGMTLVIPKKHFDSKIFEMSNKDYLDFILATKKVAELLKKSLNAERILMVAEGLDVSHAHIKLYPFFKNGSGLGLKAGPKKSPEELQKIADKILK